MFNIACYHKLNALNIACSNRLNMFYVACLNNRLNKFNIVCCKNYTVIFNIAYYDIIIDSNLLKQVIEHLIVNLHVYKQRLNPT